MEVEVVGFLLSIDHPEIHDPNGLGLTVEEVFARPPLLDQSCVNVAPVQIHGFVASRNLT